MIFKELREFDRLYEQEGSIPEPEKVSGEYYVITPCFPWISLKHLKHRKVIEEKNAGANLILNNLCFGKFELKKENDALVIDYNQPQNSFLMRNVIDKVKLLDDGRFLGKLYYNLLGRKLFVLFFEMKPKE